MATARFAPGISPQIWRLRPDFVAISIVAEDCANAPDVPWIGERLAAAARTSLTGPPWAAAHLGSWQETYRAFGAKPRRTPCSAEALRKRVERGGPPAGINAIVDLYNAVSLAYALPVGGEDMDHYVGPPTLTVARGDEPFETTKDGVPVIEYPEAGEVIWRDDRGVTCRRWNWRQTPRTRITLASRSLWFVLERLEPMPSADLQCAADELCTGLRRLAPNTRIAKQVIRQ